MIQQQPHDTNDGDGRSSAGIVTERNYGRAPLQRLLLLRESRPWHARFYRIIMASRPWRARARRPTACHLAEEFVAGFLSEGHPHLCWRRTAGQSATPAMALVELICCSRTWTSCPASEDWTRHPSTLSRKNWSSSAAHQRHKGRPRADRGDLLQAQGRGTPYAATISSRSAATRKTDRATTRAVGEHRARGPGTGTH